MTTGRINQVTFLVGLLQILSTCEGPKKKTIAKHTKALRRATQAFVLTKIRLGDCIESCNQREAKRFKLVNTISLDNLVLSLNDKSSSSTA